MKKQSYSSPLDKFLTYGSSSFSGEELDYLKLGLTQQDIPELIRMLTDEELWDESNYSEKLAPLHAMRALGQLRAEETIKPLIGQLYLIDVDFDEDFADWWLNSVLTTFKKIGPRSILPLAYYLRSNEAGYFPKCVAVEIIKIIGTEYPEVTEQCIEILTNQLRLFSRNHSMSNGMLISFLVQLKAVKSLDVIRQAYAHQPNCVDYSIFGDLETVEIELGVRKQCKTPAPQGRWIGF